MQTPILYDSPQSSSESEYDTDDTGSSDASFAAPPPPPPETGHHPAQHTPRLSGPPSRVTSARGPTITLADGTVVALPPGPPPAEAIERGRALSRRGRREIAANPSRPTTREAHAAEEEERRSRLPDGRITQLPRSLRPPSAGIRHTPAPSTPDNVPEGAAGEAEGTGKAKEPGLSKVEPEETEEQKHNNAVWADWAAHTRKVIARGDPDAAARYLKRRFQSMNFEWGHRGVAHEAYTLMAQSLFMSWRMRGETWPGVECTELQGALQWIDKALMTERGASSLASYWWSGRILVALGELERALKDFGFGVAEFPTARGIDALILAAASTGIRLKAFRTSTAYLRYLMDQENGELSGVYSAMDFQFLLARTYQVAGEGRTAVAGYERCWEERQDDLEDRGYTSAAHWLSDYRTWVHFADKVASNFLPVLEAHMLTEAVRCIHEQEEEDSDSDSESYTESSSQLDSPTKRGRESVPKRRARPHFLTSDDAKRPPSRQAARPSGQRPIPEPLARAYRRRPTENQSSMLHARLVGALARIGLLEPAAEAAELAIDYAPYDYRVRRVLLMRRGEKYAANFEVEAAAATVLQRYGRGMVTRAYMRNRHLAAARIQALARGVKWRRRLRVLHAAANEIQRVFRGHWARVRPVRLAERRKLFVKSHTARVIQRQARVWLKRRMAARIFLQARTRGFVTRIRQRQARRQQLIDWAASKIQGIVRGQRARRELAACAIQRATRRFLNRRGRVGRLGQALDVSDGMAMLARFEKPSPSLVVVGTSIGKSSATLAAHASLLAAPESGHTVDLPAQSGIVWDKPYTSRNEATLRAIAHAEDAVDRAIEEVGSMARFVTERHRMRTDAELMSLAADDSEAALRARAKERLRGRAAEQTRSRAAWRTEHDRRSREMQRVRPAWVAACAALVHELAAPSSGSAAAWRLRASLTCSEAADLCAEAYGDTPILERLRFLHAQLDPAANRAPHASPLRAAAKRVLGPRGPPSLTALREEAVSLLRAAEGFEATQNTVFAAALRRCDEAQAGAEDAQNGVRSALASDAASVSAARAALLETKDDAAWTLRGTGDRKAAAWRRSRLPKAVVEASLPLPQGRSQGVLAAERRGAEILHSLPPMRIAPGLVPGDVIGERSSGSSLGQELDEVINQMGAIAGSGPPPKNIQRTLTRLLKRCAQAGAWRDAAKVVDALTHSGAEVTALHWHALIHSCRHASPPIPARAQEVLRAMRESVPQLVSVQAFNAVLDACRAAGAWRRALQVFGDLTDARIEPTSVTFELIHDCCRHASQVDAPDVFEAMRAVGVPQDVAFSAAKQAAEGDTTAKVPLASVRRKASRKAGMR